MRILRTIDKMLPEWLLLALIPAIIVGGSHVLAWKLTYELKRQLPEAISRSFDNYLQSKAIESGESAAGETEGE